MPKFKADKEALQKALLTYDTNINIQDVVGKFKHRRGSAYDGLLIRILLDVCCSLIEPDSAKKNQLLTVLEEGLIREKVLNQQSDFAQLKGIRRDATGWFMGFISKIFTNMPNPVTNSIQLSNYSSTKIYPNTYDQNFNEIKVIASGGFGTVCKAMHKIDGNVYAVKKIYYSMEQEKTATKVLNEVRSISALSHINVVSYKNCWVQLLNRDDVEEENSATPFSLVSRVKEIDCSTPCSSRPHTKLRKKTLLQQVVSNNMFESTWEHSSRGTITPDKTGELSSESSDSLEDTDACLEALEMCSSLSYSEEDSLVQFDYSSTPVLEEPGSAVVTRERKSSQHRVNLTAMLCIQMEYCDWDLNQWLEDRASERKLPFEKDVKEIFRDIVRGVVHIHSKSIIHRDLKPSNIFYCERDGSMKIGDFGLATLGFSETSQPGVVSFESHTSNLGTFPYMAPEQKNKRNYDEKVDIYSLGIILIELLVPFKTRAEFHHTLADIERDVWPLDNPAYVDLVKNLIQKDPKQRMSAIEILDHPLIQDDSVEMEKRQLLDENKALKKLLKEKDQELEIARNEISRLKAQIEKLQSAS